MDSDLLTLPLEVSALLSACHAPSLFAKSFPEVEQLARRLAGVFAKHDLGPRTKVRVVSSFTTSFLVDALRLALFRRGLTVELEEAPYGVLVPELADPDSRANSWADLVIVLPTHRDFQFAPPVGSTAETATAAELQEARFWESLVTRARGQVVLLGFDTPRFRALGELDGMLPGGVTRHARRVNALLADLLAGKVAMVDADALQMRVGTQRWHDERLYHLCKQPFSMDAIPDLADTVAASAAALAGKARKVLVLDLDNTLWGGVIGDIGMGQIAIGPETAEGEAHTALQTYCKALTRRGVVLAVCSKNHEQFAREPFRDHPAMTLREDDIACFVANFEDKASNLVRIARTLNVGLDALVFVDDSPVERELIASALPEVLVVDLNDDPASYPAAIEALNAFPLARLTPEDLDRARSYQAIAEVASAVETTSDLDGFLRGLAPTVVVQDIASSVSRVAQLMAKTNQFKLNPDLFSEADLLAGGRHVLALQLKDRLQDYGIVAVVVTRLESNALLVDNWVMSCRVFSRRLENATLELLTARALRLGASELRLRYEASAKNILIPGILESLGFTRSDGTYSVRPVDEPMTHAPHFMTINEGNPAQ